MKTARNIRKVFLAALAALALTQGAIAQPAWENPPAWYGQAPVQLPASLPPSGPAGGDLGGTYPNPTVVSVADVTIGTLAAGNGGTGNASYAIGDLLVATGATSLSRLADVATGAVFVSGGVGTVPLWSTTSASKFGSVALGGATIGTDVLGVTGTATISGAVTLGNNINLTNSNASIGLRNQTTLLTSNAIASLQIGNFDVDTAPVAQTLRNQGALAGGTSNVAGANWTFIASPGKGTGAGGSFIFQVAPAGSTGTAVNAPATALTIDSTKLATFVGSITAANFAAASSNWTPSDASGAGVTLSCADTCKYARIGPFVYIFGDILVGANASATQVKIGGMPTAALGVNNPGSWVMSDIVAAGDIGLVSNGTTNFNVFTSAGANRTWVSLSGQTIFFSGFYAVN